MSRMRIVSRFGVSPRGGVGPPDRGGGVNWGRCVCVWGGGQLKDGLFLVVLFRFESKYFAWGPQTNTGRIFRKLTWDIN